MDGLDSRMGGLDKRMEGFEARTNLRFDEVTASMTQMEHRINHRFDQRFDKFATSVAHSVTQLISQFKEHAESGNATVARIELRNEEQRADNKSF